MLQNERLRHGNTLLFKALLFIPSQIHCTLFQPVHLPSSPHL